MNPRITSAARRSGYTLVEVMMTLTLLGIMAAMAIPSFEPDIASQLASFADVVAADLSQIRHYAVAHNSKYRITFEATQNRYFYEHTGTNSALTTLPPTIYRHAANTSSKHHFDLDEMPHLGPTVYVHRVLAMTASPTVVTTLEFGPLGSTTQSSDTVVWLRAGSDDRQRFISIRINAVTGLASPAAIDAVGPTVGG